MKAIIEDIRNIGISAHIDAGKTTLTERILFYSGKIHMMHEVKGKDGKGATMDFMELERERGITITSAATCAEWNGKSINVIDTPGHVDFTVEVERSLRVLDGAILVLCAVGGVQSQTLTVDRQMKRYSVPRIAFVNKCDRQGSDPFKVAKQMKAQLGLEALPLQYPIGMGDTFTGLVDLITMEAVYFDGKNGETIRREAIPADILDNVKAAHEKMLDSLSMHCDDLAEAFLANTVTVEQIRHAIRKAVISLSLVPVLMGSAYKNKGVQLLLDAVTEYLPSPLDVTNIALDCDNDQAKVIMKADPSLPAVLYAFKLDDGRYGQLTYMRVYQGTIEKSCELTNTRSKQRIRVGRLIRMHADEMEEIQEASAGDIVALFGVDCVSGDTFTAGGLNYSMTPMKVPRPVISLSVSVTDKKSSDILGKAIGRFTKEDPSFRSFVDPESNQTIIEGMGELHLEIYLERIRREYGIQPQTGQPQVAYRETISQGAEFNYTHKKQTGGSGQFARVAGTITPSETGEYEFSDEIRGGVIPREFIPACNEGFEECMKKGALLGFPITGVCIHLQDGAYHAVDSSDMAFRMASIFAFRQAYAACKPYILEPVMKVSIEGPEDFQGAILGGINQRRGIILGVTNNGSFIRVDSTVPLSEMFGYSTSLRSSTQGKCEFSMEFHQYERVPASISETLIKEAREKAAKKAG